MNVNKLVWALTMLASILGGMIAFASMAGDYDSVMQQTYVLVLGIGVAVVPYCFARSMQERDNK
jgi:hypothetical protein